MNIETVSKEHVMQLLNDWYKEIRARNLIKSKQLKHEIDRKIQSMEVDPTQTLFIYYSLLEFRYQLLVEDLSQADRLLEKIVPIRQTDNFLTFYYHFFKAIHATLKENYSEAREEFEKAEKLLTFVPDEIEKA